MFIVDGEVLFSKNNGSSFTFSLMMPITRSGLGAMLQKSLEKKKYQVKLNTPRHIHIITPITYEQYEAICNFNLPDLENDDNYNLSEQDFVILEEKLLNCF